tara:strand:+ start:11886 stop:12836 length:951 start_codon:yes stop_codon:yes gene_type:complete
MGNSCIKKNLISPNKNSDITLFTAENVIIDWEAKNKTQKYHWWPMYEECEGDYVNNLYSKGGGLDKYDILFGSNSVLYQKNHYYRENISNRKDAKWAGFCNNASILSCLYEYPKNDIFVCYNKKEILFKKRDIEALMIVCSENSIKENIKLFFGDRNNDSYDDSNEPYPSEFLQMLDILCKHEEPFVMDIDKDSAVWNYAFDKVIVTTHTNCELKDLELDGNTVYYNFKITSNAYPDSNQDLWGYINKSIKKGNEKEYECIKEGWITDYHPDFLWKNFKNDSMWEGMSKINPEIDASIVYKIYQHSLSNRNIALIC